MDLVILESISFVAKPLYEAIKKLSMHNKKYKILQTFPVSKISKYNSNNLYIIRQNRNGDIYEFVVSAKIENEIF